MREVFSKAMASLFLSMLIVCGIFGVSMALSRFLEVCIGSPVIGLPILVFMWVCGAWGIYLILDDNVTS